MVMERMIQRSVHNVPRPRIQSTPDLSLHAKKQIDVVSVKRFLTTDDGYVLMDLESGFLRNIMADFTKTCGDIRPKKVNHITLARDRFDESEKEAIKDLWQTEFEKANLHYLEWRIVVYELVERVPFEDLPTRGPHHLAEVLSIPMGVKMSVDQVLPFMAQDDLSLPIPRIWVC